MARKSTKDTQPTDNKVIEAAKNVLELYKQGHTVITNDDYKYPGLKELADALDKIK